MTNKYILTPLKKENYPEVRTIYENGIATGNATFEQNVPGWEEWNKKHLQHSRFITIFQNKVVGWVALSTVSERCVYDGVAEVSLYVDTHHFGKGIGKFLLNELINESERRGIWTLQAGIFPENTASLTLHKSLDFREVGFRERIGKMNGVWRNTILLERRSEKAGQ